MPRKIPSIRSTSSREQPLGTSTPLPSKGVKRIHSSERDSLMFPPQSASVVGRRKKHPDPLQILNSSRNNNANTDKIRNHMVKENRRQKIGSKVFKEIKKYQKSCDLLIPKLPFLRVVKQHSPEDILWAKTAVMALQEACEMYLVGIFNKAQLLAIHARRVTLMPRDIHLLLRLDVPLN